MWTETTKTGKFKFVERYDDNLTGQERKVSVTMDKNNSGTRKLAAQILAKKIEEKQAFKPAAEYRLSDLVRDYHDYQCSTLRISTCQRNYHSCNSIMRILGEDTLVNRLSAHYVTKRFRDSGKPTGTLNEHLRRFKALVRWGYKNDIVDDVSFLDKIENFKDVPHRTKIQDKYLEGEELKAVLKDMDNELWILLTKFLALSGLRFAEACALNKKDVDLNSAQIHINKGYDSVNRVETSTKNVFSYRDIHIQPELSSVCREINSFMLRRKLLCNIGNCPLFLFDERGEHIHYYAYNKYLKSHALNVTGKCITVHALRHTHASLLFEQGFTIDEIARRLGHGDSRVTKEIYLHVTKKLQERDNARLDHVQIL